MFSILNVANRVEEVRIEKWPLDSPPWRFPGDLDKSDFSGMEE